MRVGWSWYLAGFSGLATTALLLLSLRLSCLAERQARRLHRRNTTDGNHFPPSKPSEQADDNISVTTHSLAGSDIMGGGGIRPSTSLPSLGGGSSTNSSRASSRSSSPARVARVASVSNPQQQQQQQQQGRRYPQRHAPPAPEAQAQRAYHYS